MEEYKPISCHFYDELESASVKKIFSTIIHTDKYNQKVITKGYIIDFKIIEKVEHLIMNDGEKIRLDKILIFNDKSSSSSIYC